jgi:hypothetical protein
MGLADTWVGTNSAASGLRELYKIFKKVKKTVIPQ